MYKLDYFPQKLIPSIYFQKQLRFLRNFVKFTGQHLCQSLLLNKVAGLRLQLY